MRKIVFFIRDISDCGGIQQTTCNLINSLTSLEPEYQISIISVYNKEEKPFFEISKKIKKIVLFDNVIDLYKEVSTIRKSLEFVLSSIEYDLLIVQGAEYANYISRKVWKTKVLICEHGYFGFGHTFGFHWRGVRATLKNASCIVTLTASDANEYKKHLKRDILVCNISNSFALATVNEAISKKGCSEIIDSKTIVSCGSLVKLKGFEIAVNAAAIVLKNHHDWKWYLYGDGPQREELQRLINSFGIEEQFILQGYETDKNKIYGDKSFVVVTSEFEGFGMVLIEAMQYCLPLVSFDIKYGPREIIEDGKNGILVKNRNSIELAEKIEYLIENDLVRKKMGASSFESLIKYEPDSIAKQWIQLFDALL